MPAGGRRYGSIRCDDGHRLTSLKLTHYRGGTVAELLAGAATDYNRAMASPARQKKPVLYLDVVGTLLVDKGTDLRPADFTETFLGQVRDRFRVRLLSSLEVHQATYVAKSLHLDAEYVPYRRAL